MAGSDCVQCALKDRDIKDLEKERDQAKAEAEKAATTHPSLKSQLDHAEDGTCENCKTAMVDFKKKVIANAFAEITPQAAAELAISRGGIPASFEV